MKLAITGGTGFLGRHLLSYLADQGHTCRCGYRQSSDRGGFEAIDSIEWIPMELGDAEDARQLVEGCDAVVHSALYHPGGGFRGGEGEVIEFVERNVVGTLKLIEAARTAGLARFVFISTCAVHEKILVDRPLNEAHPLWPTSHYGAHKAAIEKFIHSYGMGHGYPICSLRPTGIYGIARPVARSKWFDLVRGVMAGEPVECSGGGKEVHALDVARAVEILLDAEEIAGEAYNCYDMYVSQYDVATIAKELTGSASEIVGEPKSPKHQIETGKLQRLGMTFGGRPRLVRTVEEMIRAIRDEEILC